MRTTINVQARSGRGGATQKQRIRYRQSADWRRMAADLQRLGVTPSNAALRLGVAEPIVRGWCNGVEPRWAAGCAFVDLWCATTGRGRDELPVLNPQIKA